jgi:hypothetical protein
MVKGLSDATRVVLDDQRVVANAGLMLPSVLADRLGIEALVDQTVCLGDRPGAANAGRKVMTLISAMALGADCIDDCDLLRSGQTSAVLGHGVMAPSTLGTFLRAFTFGHVRQLDRVLGVTSRGRGPPVPDPATGGWWSMSTASSVRSMDMTSRARAMAIPTSWGITRSSRPAPGPARSCISARAKGRPTPPAARCDLSRNSSPGSRALVRPAPSCCGLIRGSGTPSSWTACTPPAGHIRSGCASTRPSPRRLQRSPRPIGPSLRTIPTAARRRSPKRPSDLAGWSRRTRLIGAQAELWPDWRHHPFLTNRVEELEVVEAEHRQHAVVELAIRDLKDQALAHFPSGKFLANAAWTVIAAIAHNLLRWTTLIGLPDTVVATARTIRRRLITVPGRITRTGRTVTLRLPARWLWETTFLTALNRLRAISSSLT